MSSQAVKTHNSTSAYTCTRSPYIDMDFPSFLEGMKVKKVLDGVPGVHPVLIPFNEKTRYIIDNTGFRYLYPPDVNWLVCAYSNSYDLFTEKMKELTRDVFGCKDIYVLDSLLSVIDNLKILMKLCVSAKTMIIIYLPPSDISSFVHDNVYLRHSPNSSISITKYDGASHTIILHGFVDHLSECSGGHDFISPDYLTHLAKLGPDELADRLLSCVNGPDDDSSFFICIRHGETYANLAFVKNETEGYEPPILTELGIKQSKSAGIMMKSLVSKLGKDVSSFRVYTSTADRTKRTFDMFNTSNVPVACSSLDELDFSDVTRKINTKEFFTKMPNNNTIIVCHSLSLNTMLETATFLPGRACMSEFILSHSADGKALVHMLYGNRPFLIPSAVSSK